MSFNMPLPQPSPIGPGESLDFAFDWRDWLGSDTIASFQVIGPVGLALSSISQAAGVVTMWVTPDFAAAPGTAYIVTCWITTNSTPPRTAARQLQFVVALR